MNSNWPFFLQTLIESTLVPLLMWMVFSLCVLLIFRESINNLLISLCNIGSKATKIEALGVNIHLGSQTLIEGTESRRMSKAYQNQIITNEEEVIRKQISEAKLANEETISILINHLANSNFLVLVNVIDKIIYNEQIELLEYLNTHRNAPQSLDTLEQFFNKWQEKSKKTSYNFTNFLNFLIEYGLIQQNMGGYSISSLGIEYLSFIVRVGRPSSENIVNSSKSQGDEN